MPVYSFIPSPSAEPDAAPITAELPHDLAALRHAGNVLRAHPDAARVTVREGPRHVAHVPGPGRHASGVAAEEAVRASRARLDASLDLLRRIDES